MADGGWVVLGAAIGTAGSALTTWLNAYLNRDKTQRVYDKAAMSLLKRMLEDGEPWQEVGQLANVIGLSPKLTMEYLVMLGARGNERTPSLWGLVSRNPLPMAKPSN